MPKEMIAMLALQGGAAGSYNLNRAINECSTRYASRLVTSIPSYYHFGDGLDVVKQKDEAAAALEDCRKVFVCDMGGLLTLSRYLAAARGKDTDWTPETPASLEIREWLSRKSVVFYWTGTLYRQNTETMNEVAESVPCVRRYAMCDLLRFDTKALPLMQTYDDLKPLNRKRKVFTVCHSPGQKFESDKKGTIIIRSVIAQLRKEAGIAEDILRGVPHQEAIVRKGMSHVFVDQIAPEAGGIGKSGLEAMLLGVPTLCDLRHSRFYGYYAGIPVRDVRNRPLLLAAIRALIANPKERERLGLACLKWAQRLRFAPTVKYLESTLEWA